MCRNSTSRRQEDETTGTRGGRGTVAEEEVPLSSPSKKFLTSAGHLVASRFSSSVELIRDKEN